MNRVIEKTVFSGLVTACRLAGVPTNRWPSLVKATTLGVVRPPSALGMTVGSPPSITAMHEFVVPRSMPITFAMKSLLGTWLRYSHEENLSRFIAAFRTAGNHPANAHLQGFFEITRPGEGS